MASGNVVVEGINGYTSLAAPAYVSAVAAVEAFVNEMILSETPRMILKESGLKAIPERWLFFADLSEKLIVVPQLAFGKTFAHGEQPYQDMAMLIRLRNDVVHYKMSSKPPKYVADLAQKGIALCDGRYIWLHQVSTSEGIRWAHNAACATVLGLVEMMPEELRRFAESRPPDISPPEIVRFPVQPGLVTA